MHISRLWSPFCLTSVLVLPYCASDMSINSLRRAVVIYFHLSLSFSLSLSVCGQKLCKQNESKVAITVTSNQCTEWEKEREVERERGRMRVTLRRGQESGATQVAYKSIKCCF